jgi:outer membrane protein assembly factor BamB
MSGSAFRPLRVGLVLLLVTRISAAADWPQWGGGPTHNAVSLEKGAPHDFQFPVLEDGKVVKPARGVAWAADLGDRTVIPPVVADGLVWVGTSARDPHNDKIPSKDWDGGLLMCFRESDGKLLWEHRSPRLSGKGLSWAVDPIYGALGSAPLVEGDRLWYVNNRHEVVCFDIGPLKKGAGKPVEVWKLDMRKELGAFPHLPVMQHGFAASVAGHKDRLFVVTHNGVGEDHVTVPAPDAPSLVCLEKGTGKVVWKDNSPGKNILEHQISSPLVVEIDSKAQVIVGQGDGWLRSFDAATGKLIWKCDLNPKETVWELGGIANRNYVVATPIYSDGRVYIATGQQAEAGSGPGNLYCIDPTKTGDVSRELDAGPMKGKPNPNSAVVWYTPQKAPADAPRIEVGKKKKRDLFREARDFYYGRTIASATAHDGLLYAAELGGLVFCFDAKTGKLYWVEDTRESVYGQPLWVDGKVFVGTDAGTLFVFAHGKEKKVLAKIEAPETLRTGPVFANGTLYVTVERQLYAIRSPK